MRRYSIFVLIMMLLTVSVAAAQDEPVVQNATTETVQISWPPPVTEVWGTGDVLGTASVPGMSYYYLEYIPLNDDLTIPPNAPWIPATVGVTKPVVNGSLATLDTTIVPDGVYALRLTVNTVDGQSYHDVVAPVRVDNERFNAIFNPGTAAQLPEPVPTQVPQDNRPRVVPSAQYTAINVRRCDLVDNDRCPVIASLNSGESALVQALSTNNTGWFQIQLPSGVVGWVSPSVISQQGDFSAVGRTQPPTPLPVAVQLPSMIPVGQSTSSVVPNGMAIEGGTATCGNTYNVQINVANTGSAVSPEGTITVQDVNITTGEITYTGYGNYPSLNPGANFVVVMPVRVSVFFSADHELRTYTNGRQFSIRYQLAQGGCGASVVPQPPQGAQRTFAAGECSMAVAGSGEVYSSPESGIVVSVVESGTYPAIQVKRVGGVNWYQINIADASSWVIANNTIGAQGNCAP